MSLGATGMNWLSGIIPTQKCPVCLRVGIQTSLTRPLGTQPPYRKPSAYPTTHINITIQVPCFLINYYHVSVKQCFAKTWRSVCFYLPKINIRAFHVKSPLSHLPTIYCTRDYKHLGVGGKMVSVFRALLVYSL